MPDLLSPKGDARRWRGSYQPFREQFVRHVAHLWEVRRRPLIRAAKDCWAGTILKAVGAVSVSRTLGLRQPHRAGETRPGAAALGLDVALLGLVLSARRPLEPTADAYVSSDTDAPNTRRNSKTHVLNTCLDPGFRADLADGADARTR